MQQVTDDELLDLILRGELRLHSGPNDPIVVAKWHRGHKRFKELAVQHHYKTGRACYMIRIGTDGRGRKARQRKVYRNKLIWMLTHRRTPADGCHVDHKDRDRINDHPDNLRERTVHENCSEDNYPLRNTEECSRFFDWVGAGFSAETFEFI